MTLSRHPALTPSLRPHALFPQDCQPTNIVRQTTVVAPVQRLGLSLRAQLALRALMYSSSGINSGIGEVSEMGMAYDALESAPYMLLSLFSLVLSAMTLIAAAGILVTIPARMMFAIYHMVRARKHNAINPTPNRGRPELVAFALARERKRASAAVATPQEKKVA